MRRAVQRIGSRRDNSVGARAPEAAASPAANREKTPLAVAIGIWLLIIFYTVPLAGLADSGAAEGAPEGNAVSRILWVGLLALGAVVCIRRSGMALKVLRQVNPFLLVFVALATASILWSIEPSFTIKRLVRVLMILLDALALGVVTANIRAFQNVIRPALTTVLVLSVVTVIFNPEIGIEQSTASELVNAWRGLTDHKNTFGSLSALAFLFWWHALLNKERPRFTASLGVALAALCLVKSRSSTSLMATVFAACLMVMLVRTPPGMRRMLPYVIGVFVAALLAYSLAVLNLIPGSNLLLSPIAMITGKDQTFSGRTPIWQVLNEHIAYSPLLGSGYGGYWNRLPNSPSMEMLRRLYFYPNEGHNGYLDVINDLGFVGAICLIAYLVTFLRQGLAIFKTMRPQGALYITLLFEQLIGNLSESRWFNSLAFDFVLMTIATVVMARALVEQKRYMQQGRIQTVQPTGTAAARRR